MPDSSLPKRCGIGFSLATLFFVSLCIGGLLGGYHAGFNCGYHSGATQLYNETQSVETYSTLLTIGPDLPTADRAKAVENLKDLITSSIRMDIWSSGSGNEIRDFPQNQTLVITAPGSVHREIHDLFAQLESLQTRGMADQLLPALQGMASGGKAQDQIIPVSAPKSGSLASAWLEQFFDATVRGVSKHWGDPRYDGKCTDLNFPKWSLDQRIVTWPRGKGLSYLALRVADDGQLHIVAGWTNES